MNELHRIRGKRSRHETSVMEDPQGGSSSIAAELGAIDQAPRSHAYPLDACDTSNTSVLQYFTPAAPLTSQGSQAGRRLTTFEVASMAVQTTTADLPFLGQVSALDVEAGGITDGGGANQMSELEKAKRDWETHITAMEQVLATNKARGLPTGAISSDALQLLSQMVSNLYCLNSKLLYAETQQVLDAHRKNVERINDVFQGLAGLKAHGDLRKD